MGKQVKKFFRKFEQKVIRPILKELKKRDYEFEYTDDGQSSSSTFRSRAAHANKPFPKFPKPKNNSSSKGNTKVQSLLDERQKKQNQMSVKEPELWSLYQQGVSKFVDEIVTRVTSESFGVLGVTIYQGCKVYGTLFSKARTEIATNYFRMAEDNIARWCDSNPNASESEFHNMVEREIDIAFDLSIDSFNIGY